MTPLKLLLTSFLLANTVLSYCQLNKKTEETFYAFDVNWQGAPIEKAVYFARCKKINDTCWQWDTYHMYGPLIKTERFKDEKGSTAHGRFIIYNSIGSVDSICNYSNGYPHGTWNIFNDSSGMIEQKYDMGKLISTKTTKREKDPKQKDTTAKKDEKESEYTGGLGAWQRYLNRNLRYPNRALKVGMQGMVVVSFIVDTEGNIEDPTIWESIEYSLDEEALHIIRESPQWIPAIQFGKKVKSYKRQPINFTVPK
jgi:protein TonB